jgi:hypothetical protein
MLTHGDGDGFYRVWNSRFPLSRLPTAKSQSKSGQLQDAPPARLHKNTRIPRPGHPQLSTGRVSATEHRVAGAEGLSVLSYSGPSLPCCRRLTGKFWETELSLRQHLSTTNPEVSATRLQERERRKSITPMSPRQTATPHMPYLSFVLRPSLCHIAGRRGAFLPSEHLALACLPACLPSHCLAVRPARLSQVLLVRLASPLVSSYTREVSLPRKAREATVTAWAKDYQAITASSSYTSLSLSASLSSLLRARAALCWLLAARRIWC